MIEKIEHKGVEHVYLHFGHGTIEVMTGGPENVDYENKPTDVIFGMTEKAHEIGKASGLEHDCTTELTSPVIMRFYKPESIDVVINALKKIKASLS